MLPASSATESSRESGSALAATSRRWAKIAPLSRRLLVESLERARQGEEITLWSPRELAFLRSTSPTAALEIAQIAGRKLEVERAALRMEARAVAETVFLTLDNGLLHGKTDPGVIKSKVNNLNYAIRALGSKIPILDDQKLLGSSYARAVFTIKQTAIDILRSTAHVVDRKPPIFRNPAPQLSSILRSIFGNQIVAVFQYGSSLNGGGKDIDIFVVLKSITEETYIPLPAALKNVRIGDKPLGIVLYPENALYSFARFHEQGVTSGQELVQVLGVERAFATMTTKKLIQNDLFKAGKELRTLRGVLKHTPILDKLSTEGGLLDYYLKLELWIARSLRQAVEKRIVSKQEMLTLEKFPSLRGDPPRGARQIEAALILANLSVSRRLHNFQMKMSAS